ncbi:pteridine reductase [Marinobacter adhaerens]|jgi:pteridine reductase|uniref:Pteridine reductase n=2 Tax=Marinobacter adhaerens TaxID=1033846 RepID=A0ABX8IG58_9GAMM|nr:pteridine reductase [Marinobacter adhaerens]ADP98759.1 short-chain dehydrogenase/reductase SDR [Marinobacter adhaerens HP15]MBW4976735.1 pteridine reductase [Marinobacter adhaerens]QWV12740.1 pteridine reductase [Marinobacter adhaerens]
MPSTTPVALITGAAHRLGAQTARTLHERGWNLVIHYRSREEQANSLIAQMNRERPDSACALRADLSQLAGVDQLASDAVAQWGRLDALVNNASVFYPTPTADATEDDWDTILNTNLRAPFFLLQKCLAELRRNRGSVVNLIDIYSERPIDDHPLYCATKAGLAALTRSWAKDLAPDVRVNGVSPGAILWPEGEAEMDQSAQQAILQKTPLARTGNPDDISKTIAFLICDAPFITGQIISVDGGRSLNM